jgi:hypothetical protein
MADAVFINSAWFHYFRTNVLHSCYVAFDRARSGFKYGTAWSYLGHDDVRRAVPLAADQSSANNDHLLTGFFDTPQNIQRANHVFPIHARHIGNYWIGAFCLKAPHGQHLAWGKVI